MKATCDVTKREWEREWKTRKPDVYITVKDAKPHVMLLKAGSYLAMSRPYPKRPGHGRNCRKDLCRPDAKHGMVSG